MIGFIIIGCHHSVYQVTYNIHHGVYQVTYNINHGVYQVTYIYQCVSSYL
jgi:hypothetical protein